MHSSTSSFSPARLLRVLAACVAVLAAWQALIWCHAVPPSTGIHQWEDNVIRAERYADTPPEAGAVVLAGTSLMARLRPQVVGARVQNIAFSGGAPATGVEMVRRHPAATALVVEMSNVVARPMDTDLVDASTGGLSWLRRVLPAFRREYQPATVLVSAWKAHVLREREAEKARIEAKKHKKKQPDKPAEKPKPKTRPPMVDNVVTLYQKPLTPEQLQALHKGAEDLRARLQAVRQTSTVRIFLAHLPLDPAVEVTLNTQETLKLLHEVFPSPEWQWLPAPPAHDWETLDGQHLTEASADIYAQHLRESLQASGVVVD